MLKLATYFLGCALMGAAISAAAPSHAYYFRSVHSHSCLPTPVSSATYTKDRLQANSGIGTPVIASCPIPEDYTASLAQQYYNGSLRLRTAANNNQIRAKVTAFVYDPSTAASVVVTFCSGRRNGNAAYCTQTAATGAASGYRSLTLEGNWPVESGAVFPVLQVTLPASAALHGFGVEWP